jgi:RNase H-fold protein (predicted Holliday junction resolvase)
MLSKIFGDPEIIHYRNKVQDVNHVLNLIREYNADEVVTVLPLTIIKRLCEHGVKPIIAKMVEVNGRTI